MSIDDLDPGQKPPPEPSLNGQPRRRRDFLRPLVFGLVAIQVLFRVVPEFRPGIAGVLCWLFGLELVPMAATGLLGLALVAAAFRRPFWTKRRAWLWGILLLLVFSGGLFARYPSSFDGKPSRVPFRVPLDGPVTVGWGGGTPSENYHVVAPDQRWAYDMLVSREGKTHKGDGSLLSDYYVYDKPIVAPAEGVVMTAFDGDPDMPPGKLGGGTLPTGNHVVLKVAEGEYAWLCHMKPGSVTVKRGDVVKSGQPLGLVGNSGNTSEPHLHVHLQNTTTFGIAEGIPMPFHHYKTADGTLVESGTPTGGISADGALAGEIIENALPEPVTP